MNIESRLEQIEKLLKFLVADRAFDSKVPLPMRDAALVCHVELRTLRQWVDRKEIPAYRNGANSIWRVFPKDIQEYLTKETNLAPARRVRVIKSRRNVLP